MKSIIRFITCLYLISSCLFLKMKTSNSAFLNSLFEKLNSHEFTKQINVEKINKFNSFDELHFSQVDSNETIPEESKNTSENKNQPDEENPEINKVVENFEANNNKLQGWFGIKSENFSNSRVFLKNDFKYDENFYRLNSQNPSRKKEFFFILTDKYLFYKSKEDTLEISQNIEVDNINNLKYSPFIVDQYDQNILHCISFDEKYNDRYNNNYKMCTKHEKDFKLIFCKLAELKHVKNLEQCSNTPQKTYLKIEEIETQIVPIPSRKCNKDFNYKNHGDDWECLCKEGNLQSPIDLPLSKNAILTSLTPIFLYNKIPVDSVSTTKIGLLKETKHSEIKFENEVLKIKNKNMGNIVTINNELFRAEEIILHTPSEHTISGKRFDMEMQVIFFGKGKGTVGKQIVLVFLFEKKAGYFNKFLDDLDFSNLPNINKKSRRINDSLFIPKVLFNNIDDADEIISSKPFSFYSYEGSLTQPPCSEDTTYYVASDPIPLASITIQMAEEALKNPDEINQLYEQDGENDNEEFLGILNGENEKNEDQNYRATQKLNGRKVYFYDHKVFGASFNDFIEKKNNSKNDGKSEKFEVNKMNFVNMEDEKPTEIPEANVLSEKQSNEILGEI